MTQEKLKVRNELKYFISSADYHSLRNILKHAMHPDENSQNGGYHVRSLYYDDLQDSALYEKNFGVKNRKKYRIRVYNQSDQVISLERKRKYNDKTNKESFKLNQEQYQKIADGDVDFLRTSGNDVAEQFYYEFQNQFLRPRVIVDYFREPYVMTAGNVRVTFDQNLTATTFAGNLFEDKIGRPILSPGTVILEVKYDEFIPNIIKMYLGMVDKKPLAISKYVLCREKIINNEWGV